MGHGQVPNQIKDQSWLKEEWNYYIGIERNWPNQTNFTMNSSFKNSMPMPILTSILIRIDFHGSEGHEEVSGGHNNTHVG